MEDINNKIQSLADRVISGHGMDLIELKVSGSKNDVFIQIIADKPSGGINIHDCAILNKSLVAAIEQEHLLSPENFSLELSSPGLDRPLVTQKDFMRLIGQEIHFWLNEATNGKKELEGKLMEVREESLIIDNQGKTKIEVPLIKIIKGMLIIP